MKNTRQKLAGLAACLLPIALFLALNSAHTVRSSAPVKAPAELLPPPKDAKKEGKDPFGFAGSMSCTGRGCHGAITPNVKGIGQNEFTTWVRHDPHARAYHILTEPRAKQMAENLAVLNGGKKINAHEDPKCLVCHSTPEYATGTTPELRALQSHGISCETCHGAAEKKGAGWLEAHTTKQWRDRSPAGKEKAGMKVLSDTRGLAQACIGCHVGSPTQDLNHDLMAAGHPRLVFELGTYYANLPKHWREDKYKADPTYEAKLWAMGRVESARASLELLAVRAKDESKPWPEFAESDCFSCHANLRPESNDWRRRPGYRDPKVRAPGALPYNEWFSTGLPELAKSVGDSDVLRRKDFTELGRLMSKPYPVRKEVIAQADLTLNNLTALSEKIGTLDPLKVRAALLAVDDAKLAALSWDEATQLVYSLAALHAASGKSDSGVTEKFAELYKALAYPEGFESPADFRREGAKKETDKLTTELIELVKLFK